MARRRKGGFRWDDRMAKAVARKAGMQALKDGAETVLAESIKEVPHATGTLQRSATVTVDDKNGRVYVSYSTPYAIRQHEDLTLRHPDPTNPISSSGRKAKFLEDPFRRNKPKIRRLSGLRIRKALRDAK